MSATGVSQSRAGFCSQPVPGNHKVTQVHGILRLVMQLILAVSLYLSRYFYFQGIVRLKQYKPGNSSQPWAILNSIKSVASLFCKIAVISYFCFSFRRAIVLEVLFIYFVTIQATFFDLKVGIDCNN